MAVDLRAHVRDVADFPQAGILFRDITPLMASASALAQAVDALHARVHALNVDLVVAPEARGFMLGGALAVALGAGFVPARKPGRLPAQTMSAEYALEYATDSLELHVDALAGSPRVLVHDDLLATGGTAAALCGLVGSLSATVVGCAFVIELDGLGGRRRLAGRQVESLLRLPAAASAPGVN